VGVDAKAGTGAGADARIAGAGTIEEAMLDTVGAVCIDASGRIAAGELSLLCRCVAPHSRQVHRVGAWR
jgi:hypothetical protein